MKKIFVKLFVVLILITAIITCKKGSDPLATNAHKAFGVTGRYSISNLPSAAADRAGAGCPTPGIVGYSHLIQAEPIGATQCPVCAKGQAVYSWERDSCEATTNGAVWVELFGMGAGCGAPGQVITR